MPRFNTSQHPLTQIDEDTNAKWEDLSHDEQVWLYRQLLGRDPVAGEIQNQINMGKSIKYFVHGTRQELATRRDNGDERAKRALRNLNGWEGSIESTALGSFADAVGVKEIADPFSWIAEETGIKEIGEYGPLALQIGATVFGGPMGAIGASMFNAGVYGDWSDVFEGGIKSTIETFIPTVALQAGYEVGESLLSGEDLDDAFADGLTAYAAGSIGATTADVIPFVSNETLVRAGVKYAVDGDPKSAFTYAAASAAMQEAQRMRQGGVHDADYKGSFKEWAAADAAKSLKLVQEGSRAVRKPMNEENGIATAIAKHLKTAWDIGQSPLQALGLREREQELPIPEGEFRPVY